VARAEEPKRRLDALTHHQNRTTDLGPRGRAFDRSHPFIVGFTATLGVVVAVGLVLGIRHLREVLIPIGLALFIAVGLDPAVRYVARWMPRWAALLLVSFAALAIFAGFLAAAIPPLSSQITQFAHELPRYLNSIKRHNGFLGHLDARYHIISTIQKKVSTGSTVSKVANSALGVGKFVARTTTETLITIVLTVYFLGSLPRVKRTAYGMVPASRRARVEALSEEILDRVGGFVLGNIFTSVIAGAGTLVWLVIFGVPYALLLAIFVGLMDLIPIVGSTIGGIIVSLVALTKSLPVAIATAAFYVLYRFLEDYLITPKVMSRTVEVSGLVTVVVVLIGGALLGIVGALVAIPTAAAVQLIFREVVAPSLDQE
jgi:predicted PurR-regulated permease PerM